MKWCLLLIALGLGGPGVLRSQTTHHVATGKESGFQIKVDPVLGVTPQIGTMPVEVTITNRSPHGATWTLRSTSQFGFSRNQISWSENPLGAPAAGTSSRGLLLPVFPVTKTARPRSGMNLDLSGPGVRQGRWNLSSTPFSSGSTATAFIAMSQTLETKSWGELQAGLKKKAHTLVGSGIQFLPVLKDWRAWLGMDVLWMTPEDYASLSAEVRAAMQDWVLQGGVVVFCLESGQSLPPPFRSQSTASVGEETGPVTVGFGAVQRFAWDGQRLDLAKTMEEIVKQAPRRTQALENGYSSKKVGFIQKAGTLSTPTTALLLVIVLFAVTMGPLNLYWFAPLGKRHRLFWTVPLISTVAALLLGALILLSDGTGGSGARVMLRLIDPERKRLVILQEQASKTGLLLSRDFELPETAFLLPVQSDLLLAKKDLGQIGNRYVGDWFSSRSLQMQVVESVGPTREALVLLNPEELAGGAAPVVLSQLPAVLEELRWRDTSGQEWGARDVVAGRKTTLQRMDAKAEPLAGFAKKVGAGGLIQSHWKEVSQRPGYFYAVSANVPDVFLPTLPSIRWRSNSVLWCGRIQKNQTP